MRITVENFQDFIDGSWDYDYEKEVHTGIWIRSKIADVTGGIASKEQAAEFTRMLEFYKGREYSEVFMSAN